MNAATQNQETLPLVRAQVKNILTNSQAFRSLPEAKRRELAHDMVRVAGFIVGGETGDNVPQSATLANANERPPDPAGETSSQRLGASGAVAAREGVQQFTRAVQDVNFPEFVRSLIDGVFNAIVKSSIQQMDAYAELVKNVAKSADQYMKDNVTANQSRDYLAQRYPEVFEIDVSGKQPKLKTRQGYDSDNLPDFAGDLGLKAPVESLDDDTVEQELVLAARRRMALDRQQLLATMVLMGINRLIVTDGYIDASVLFELKTEDLVTRGFTNATDYDSHYKSHYKSSGWFSPTYTSDYSSNMKVSTARSEDSQAKVDLHAKLGGKVKVNFKSETFPLERMADVMKINQIQEKVPGRQAAAPAPVATSPAPTPVRTSP